EGSECILCPVNWLKHRGKCYWLSEKIRNWQNSRDDCLTNNSQILVVQDENEMAFMRNITQGSNLVWIGLSVSIPEKKWIWANGSRFDEKLFKIEGPPNQNSCVAIRRNDIQSETCNAQYGFICKKNGF
uniref:C-type lectin domain-containing protein n=1 Tax=Pelodiscus sinensis TaxID=13735 RepID=K7GEA1_PELSI